MIYSTEDVHPRERMSYWREVAARGYVPHDTLPADRASFAGSVHVTSLPGIGLSKFNAAAHHVHRATGMAQHDCNDLMFSAVTSGEVVISQDGRECVLREKGLYLIDPTRPFDLVLRKRSTHIIAKIPRRLLDARVGNTADLTARLLDVNSGVGSLAFGFMELLPEQAEGLDDISGLKIAEHVLDLTALALASSRENKSATLSSPRAVALLRLKATIERLLIEPGIKPDRIAAAAGISVRYANALLAEENWSIERYLNERRLERCRSALENAAQDHRSISEIAFTWGFSDLSHFGRRFKARYGMPPTDYRRAHQLRKTAATTARLGNHGANAV